MKEERGGGGGVDGGGGGGKGGGKGREEGLGVKTFDAFKTFQDFRWRRIRVARMVDGPFGAGGDEEHDDARSDEKGEGRRKIREGSDDVRTGERCVGQVGRWICGRGEGMGV